MFASKPIKIFFSYAHEDEELRDRLAKHLRSFERLGLIESWHDREITAGTEWNNQIDANLEEADIILLLISSDFIDSDYCYDIEMKRAMQRHESGEATVIVIILRSCKWMDAPFGKLQALPKDAKPVTRWEDEDEAFENIAQGIEEVIDKLNAPPPTPKASVGINRISKIEASESSPPAPTSPAKWLRGWTIEEKHWPLFLIFLIPLHLLSSSDVTDPRFLTLTGITLLVAGILYWIVRRQIKRLWMGGPMGIVGGGLIVAAIMMPICSPIKPPSNKAIQESDNPGLAVTVAEFTYSDAKLKKAADDFNTTLINQLEIEDAITTIKKYNFKIVDGQKEKINTHVLLEECKCDVFVTGEIKRSKEGDPRANVKITNVPSQSASNNVQQNSKVIELEKITLTDQKDYSGLVSLLVGYAHYKWGKWQKAIDQLEKLNTPDYKDLHSEMYFYIGMSLFEMGFQAQNADQMKTATSNFKKIRESFAEKPDDPRNDLRVAASLYWALAKFYSISFTLQAEAKTDTVKEIDEVINELEDLGKKWDSQKLGNWGACNLAYTNLFMVLAKKYKITGNADGLIAQANIAVNAMDNCDRKEAGKAKAVRKLNFGKLMAQVSRGSDNRDQFEERFREARKNFKEALEYFKDNDLVQYQVQASNSLSHLLTERAIYLGNESGELIEASNLYKEVLELLPKENSEERAFTRYSQAFTFIELNDYEDAITACEEAIKIYEAIKGNGKSYDLDWADANRALGKAKYLKGRNLLDKGMLSDANITLSEAVVACNAAKAKYEPGTESWFRSEQICGDACLALIALNQGAARAQNLQCARESYDYVQLLCDQNQLIFKRLCEEARASQNLLPRN